jgi:putative ABC transport system permease protein
MKLQKSLQLAINILINSKIRTWLTIIGIVIGVAAVVAIVSIGEGAQANVQARLGGLGADLITVSSGGGRAQGQDFGRDFSGPASSSQRTTSSNTIRKNLTTKDIQVIKSIEGVAFVNPTVSDRETMVYLAESTSVSITGVDPLAWKNIVTTDIASGRYLNPSDTNSIVIGSRVAASTFKQPLQVNTDVTIGTRNYKVVGVLVEAGGGDDNRIYMPIVESRILFEAPIDRVDSITIKAASVDAVDLVANQTDSRLMLSRHVTTRTKDYSVTTAKATMARIESVTGTLTLFLGAIAAVSLIVGAVGIANTMFTSVLEKTKEIGVMKAIGAKNRDIMMIFLLNSALVGLVGGILGILLGSGISLMLPNLMSGLGGGGMLSKTAIPTSLLVEALGLSVAIGMISGAIPAYRASKLKPVDALRYE